MPVWLELTLTRKQEEYRYLGAARCRRQMSLPNGSIANLLVTRKSFIASNLESPSPVPFPYGDGLDESANKKAGAGRAPAVASNKKPAL